MIDWAGLAIGLGIGGAVGAAAAVVLAGGKLVNALHAFADQFKAYAAHRNDPDIVALRAAFQDVETSAQSLVGCLERLGRAVKRR